MQVGQTQEQHMNRLRQTLVKGQLAKKVMHYRKGLGGCISCSWDIESIVLYNGVEWYTADVKWCHGKSLASTGNLTDDVNVDFRKNTLATLSYKLLQPQYTCNVFSTAKFVTILWLWPKYCIYTKAMHNTRCYFNVQSKADTNQLNLPHGTNN